MSMSIALRSEGSAAITRVKAPLRLALLLVLGALMLALQVRLRGETDVWSQVAGQLVAFAIFLPAALLCWRGLRAGWIGVALVLVLAVGFRAACVTPGETPPLSTDLHRYAWDARVQAAGINPYRYRPTAPELEHLRDDTVWPGINLPTWRTVYPPGAEASFLAARAAFGDRLGASTLLFLLAEAGAVASPPRRPGAHALPTTARARRPVRVAPARRSARSRPTGTWMRWGFSGWPPSSQRGRPDASPSRDSP